MTMFHEAVPQAVSHLSCMPVHSPCLPVPVSTHRRKEEGGRDGVAWGREVKEYGGTWGRTGGLEGVGFGSLPLGKATNVPFLGGDLLDCLPQEAGHAPVVWLHQDRIRH